MEICPVCSGEDFSIAVISSVIQRECEFREQLIERRVSHPLSSSEKKDLTDFFHSANAEILVCAQCSLLIRHELEAAAAETYSEDQYDPQAIEPVYPRYLSAFRAKERLYRSLLPSGARVLEIGSHNGAFLKTAGEWGWQAEGIDIGEDTSRFARSKGFLVHNKQMADCDMPASSRDAVFIWNCFEQMPDPACTLQEAHRILKPGGLLVVRTPNGLFYSMCHLLLGENGLRPGARELLLNAMAYNNLLGFPYLYGHQRSTLNRLIERFGFSFEDGLNSELLTLPLPDRPDWVEHQEQAVNDNVRLLARSILADSKGVLTGPWIEVWHRRV
jgi:SAM-dependent methyltransferase